MIQIRPVSDIRNKFSEIEALVKPGQPVYLTKNGYGTMVLIDLEDYDESEQNEKERIGRLLLEADEEAERSSIRYDGEEMFDRLYDEFGTKTV